MSKCWIYHETEDPKIVDAEEAESYYKEGWADSPAKWLNLSDCLDMENETEVQIVGEVMQETADRANDLLNVKKAQRKDLLVMAERYGVDAKGLNVKPLRAAVTEAINGNSA
jgi:hypothetical protein